MNFKDIRDHVAHLARGLEILEEDGVLRMGGERMMLLRADSFGFLRRELVNTLGPDLARGTLKRYGFQSGFGDAHALCRQFPGLSLEEQMHMGTWLHQRQGVVRVETLEGSEVNLEAGVLALQARWLNSVEAAAHVDHLGQSKEPACWSLTGYASGHLSYLLQRDVIAVERECAAQGGEHCVFEVGFKEEMGRRWPGCERDYQSLNLVKMLEDLREQARRQSTEIEKLKGLSPVEETGPFSVLIGAGGALKKVIRTAKAVAGVDTTVLITGSSGTGKELMARALHEASPRKKRPFVAVNCATLTEALQNAQLFGYVRGAFTGAVSDRPGLFEAADGGTLFLDEVGELQASAQAALLRVLQEGKISRVGETRERAVDVRLVAATHRSLGSMAGKGGFREDLFYRLNVVNLRMPDLKDRENDVLLLSQFFLKANARRFKKTEVALSPEVKRLFLNYHWPGNIRELQNTLERAVLLCEGSQITLDDLPECLLLNRKEAGSSGATEKTPEVTYDERSAILEILRQTGGAKEEAAKRLGISRATLWRKMKTYGLPGAKSYYAKGI